MWVNADAMTAVWARVRAELRAKWRSMVVLALVVGIAGGAALTAFAGARRTSTAVGRFLAYARSPDLGVFGPDRETLSKIEHLPQVAESSEGAYVLMAKTDAAGHPTSPGDVGTQAVVRNPAMSRPLVIAGRLPRWDRVGEVLINSSAAAKAL